jgi:hypothetical protein
MPQVPFTSFYLGPLAVYPSNTGLLDPITGAPQKGGNFNQGDYCDLSASDARVWNQQYSTSLYPGRYRIVGLSPNATAANVLLGMPAALALGTSVDSVVIKTAGSGQTAGTYTVAASSGAAVIQVVVGSAGTVISATVLNGGVYATGTVPTFTLVTGGTVGTVLAHMSVNENLVTSWDSSAVSLTNDPRGLFLAPVTSTQITAGAWIIVQELGVATALVATATTTAAGSTAYVSATAGVITTNVGTAYYQATLGKTIDIAAAATLTRLELSLPVRQG